MIGIKSIKIGTLQDVLLEDDTLRLLLSPQLAAKVISLVYKPTRREFSFKVPQPEYWLLRWGEPFVN